MNSMIRLSLTDDLLAFVDANSGDGTLYATPGEFVIAVLREKMHRMEASAICEAALDGLQDVAAGRTVEYRGDLKRILRKTR